jgi:DNA excision repair protein ERCC-3
MMQIRPDNPIIVQGDGKVLLETTHAQYEEARDFLGRFAELEASPDLLHTYRITPISLWNAACSGMTKDDIVEKLRGMSKFDIPPDVLQNVSDTIERYGLVKLKPHPDKDNKLIRLDFYNAYIAKLISNEPTVKEFLVEDGRRNWGIQAGHRGIFKQRMLSANWPVEDLVGFLPGEPLKVNLRDKMRSNGKDFGVRPYQATAAARWHLMGLPAGGHGVVVLPCGAGKTIVAMETMRLCQTHTLILATNEAAVNQWVRELIDKTHLTSDQVGAYMGSRKEIKPVTVATYQILTWRRSKQAQFEHLHLFEDHNWGLLVYDEVHLLPAPVFGATATLQGRRRLGLTATLVREDGREADVFALVGPKRYDLPWKMLERDGFIAEALCHEVRVSFINGDAETYEMSNAQTRFRFASTNSNKMPAIQDLVDRHQGDNILIIGTYVAQLEEIARIFKAPLITGKTPHRTRDVLFDQFRTGKSKLLVVSKVANFSIDLPDANVAIQVSGSFGSRQEEAQRLGRILRPKKDGGKAHFYTIVTADTKEQEFALKRQLFMTEQGYRYTIEDKTSG